MWKIWMVLRLTPVNIYIYIYMFILFVACISCLFICSMFKNHFVLNGIVEIASGLPNAYGGGSKHRCVG